MKIMQPIDFYHRRLRSGSGLFRWLSGVETKEKI
jgi:hypothetical protein